MQIFFIVSLSAIAVLLVAIYYKIEDLLQAVKDQTILMLTDDDDDDDFEDETFYPTLPVSRIKQN